jgi:hypothetical protein
MIDVSVYYSQLNEWQIQLFEEISEFILLAHPNISMKLKYGVPFFEYRGGFIYFSYNKSEKATILGFTRGHLFQQTNQFLVANQGQTQVRHLVFKENEPIDWSKLTECIREAIYWQEVLARKCNC